MAIVSVSMNIIDYNGDQNLVFSATKILYGRRLSLLFIVNPSTAQGVLVGYLLYAVALKTTAVTLVTAALDDTLATQDQDLLNLF